MVYAPSHHARGLPSAAAGATSSGQGRRRAATGLLGLFFVTTLVAPAAVLNKVVFLLLGLWTLVDLLFAVRPRVTLVIAPFGVAAVFAYGLFISLMGRADNAMALQLFLSVFILFLIHFVERYRIDLDRLAEFAGVVLVAFTALLWWVTLVPDAPMAGSLQEFFRT